MSLASRSFFRPQGLALAAAALLSSVAVSAHAKNVVCVWDVAGKSGDVYAASTDYALAMQKHGADMELKGYVDERVAIEDFRAGQCDAVVATSSRTRQFNGVAGSIDSIGSTLVIKNGKVDIDAGYEVLRKVIQVFAAPAAGKLMEAELDALNAALGDPQRPVAAVVGGAKVSTKLDLLANLVTKVDHLIIGGGIAAFKSLELIREIRRAGGSVWSLTGYRRVFHRAI